MEITVKPTELSGSVSAIASKSQAHRALICAALSDAPTRIVCQTESNDITATAECLRALGAVVDKTDDGYMVKPLPVFAQDAKIAHSSDGAQAILPCKESGSTFRFMLPIVGALLRRTPALERGAAFLLEGRLPERPLSPLYEELTQHGCKLSPQGTNPFCIEGQLCGGKYELDGGVSSQFVSGLLFALPLLAQDSSVKITGKIESQPYIEMTLAMLSKFGIQIDFENNTYFIRGGQAYRSPETAYVEGDWSNVAFWLAAGAVGVSGVACKGLDLNSHQGDRAIMDILARFGASVWVQTHIHADTGDVVTAKSGALKGIEFDAADTPDLVPIVSVVAAVADGETRIIGAERLRIKESDRLAAVTAMLGALGADIKETQDGLVINGKGGKLNGGTVSSFNDHRIAMSAAIAATLCEGPVTIQGAEAVNKSYPGFFEDFQKLGGVCEEI